MNIRFLIKNEESVKVALERSVLGVLNRNNYQINRLVLMTNVDILSLYLSSRFDMTPGNLIDLSFDFNGTKLCDITIKIYKLIKEESLENIELPQDYLDRLFKMSITPSLLTQQKKGVKKN